MLDRWLQLSPFRYPSSFSGVERSRVHHVVHLENCVPTATAPGFLMDPHAAKRHADRELGAAPLTTRADAGDAEAQEVVLRLDGGAEVSVPITKAAMDNFRGLVWTLL